MTEIQTLARRVVELVDAATAATDDKEGWKRWQEALMLALELDARCSHETSAIFNRWLTAQKALRAGIE